MSAPTISVGAGTGYDDAVTDVYLYAGDVNVVDVVSPVECARLVSCWVVLPLGSDAAAWMCGGDGDGGCRSTQAKNVRIRPVRV